MIPDETTLSMISLVLPVFVSWLKYLKCFAGILPAAIRGSKSDGCLPSLSGSVAEYGVVFLYSK